MKTRFFLLAALLAFIAPQFSSAQNNSNSTPPQLVELVNKAIANYPRLKEGNQYIALSETQRDLTRAVYMPVIEGDASYRYGKPTPSIQFPVNGQTVDISFVPANNYDFHLALTQPIWDFGRTRASVKKALADIQVSKDNKEGGIQIIAYQVAQLYYGIVYLNKSIEVQNEQINLLKENEKIINDKLKDGDAIKYDLLATQVKINNAQNLLIDIQTNLKKQYEMLNMFTGGDGEGYITQKEVNYNEISGAEVSADNNYDIITGNDKLTSLDWSTKAAKRGWLPTVIAQAKAGYQNGWVPEINKLLFTYSAGVGLSIPIFSSARPNYQTKLAKINAQAAKYNLEVTRLNLNKDILQAKSDIEASANKLKNYELQVEQAQEALKLANIRYKGGIITNLEVLSSQTDLENAQLGRIQLEYNLLLSKLQLNKYGGVKFW